MKQPQISSLSSQILIKEIKKSQLALNQGSSPHQSFQQIQQTMQCVDVFDQALRDEDQNEHTLISFQIFD
jgi:hypothetical protein